MKISWHIKKSRGNYRPVLTWTIRLDPAETELGLSPVSVDTRIPRPCDNWEAHCFEGRHERIGNLAGTWELVTPSFWSGKAEGKMVLPWRKDNAYPEIEAGFERVRDAIEMEVERATQSLPMETGGELEMGLSAKRKLAPARVADRMLGLSRKTA